MFTVVLDRTAARRRGPRWSRLPVDQRVHRHVEQTCDRDQLMQPTSRSPISTFDSVVLSMLLTPLWLSICAICASDQPRLSRSSRSRAPNFTASLVATIGTIEIFLTYAIRAGHIGGCVPR